VDPSGHKPQFEERDGGGTANPNAHSVYDNPAINTIELLTPVGSFVALQDPNSSYLDKALAIVGFIPAVKIEKEIGAYLLSKGGLKLDLQFFASAGNNNKITNLVNGIKSWLGPEAKLVINKSGDIVLLSKDGKRRERFDINNPSPHQSPHGHVEELVNGKWKKSGQLYPKDVPHK
jgi:hypothetical protein